MCAKSLLILVDGDFVGGAETNYRFILPGLIDRGWSPVFVCPDDRNLRAYFESLNFRIETETGLCRYPPFSVGGRTSFPNLFRVFAAVRVNRRKVIDLARKHQTRAVVSNSMVSHLLNATLPGDQAFRRIVHLHDIVDRRKAKGLYGLGIDWISRRADAIITISDAVVDTVPERERSKLVKLYNPIGEMPNRERTEGHPLRVGMFARYTPWKGHRDLLRIAETSESLPIEFVSFGNISENDSGYMDELRQGVVELKNAKLIHLEGFTPDPLQQMADCDFVLHLSTSPEPFGRVLIEANACGVPVLAYRGGGVDELFENLKLEGERFENGDWRAIAEVLKTASVRLGAESGHRICPPAGLETLWGDRYAESFLEVCNG